MYTSQYDASGGSGAAALFSGGGFMPSQATQTPDASSSKSRGGSSNTTLPVTIKQIIEAYHSNDDKSNFAIDGVEATTVRILGRVVNKAERVTDVSFCLDDGTGKIDVNRWVNETSDTNEMAIIQIGMYVAITGSLKGFQGKRHVVAFSVKPVMDFNQITLHFIECIHVHLDNTRFKTQSTGVTGNRTTYPPFGANTGAASFGSATPLRNDLRGYQTPHATPMAGSGSGVDVRDAVLGVFQEPASLAREHGLHVDEVIRRLAFPEDKIRRAIDYHVDVGNIYSTIDEYHFKSACNG